MARSKRRGSRSEGTDPSGGPPSPAASAAEPSPPAPAAKASPWPSAVRGWASAHRVELALFLACYAVLAGFSGQRFLRQSDAPHFVYQAQAWLDGRLDLDPSVLPNLEDWACVREVGGEKVRCEGPVRPGDKWYVSFPAFPSVVMLPFVALNGYQFNDTSFGVFVAALAVAFFYSLLRLLQRSGESGRDEKEDIALALLLPFGTLFFYCAIRGEVWFSAEVMGVLFTALYLRHATLARRPVLAGLFFSMATLTRTPLLFSGVYFVLECFAPGPGTRRDQLRRVLADRALLVEKLRKVGLFAAGAAPLALLAAAYNFVRFGSLGEFGHRFLYNNRVNADIDRYGLFNPVYLARNLQAAFLDLPKVSLSPFRLEYDPFGMSLLLTLPILVFILFPRERRRLRWPLWITVAACAVPGFFYQNTGYMQFGFRFSLDYTPHLLLLFAIGGWSLRNRWVQAVAALGVLVNFWGAAAFRGYTELMRNW